MQRRVDESLLPASLFAFISSSLAGEGGKEGEKIRQEKKAAEKKGKKINKFYIVGICLSFQYYNHLLYCLPTV